MTTQYGEDTSTGSAGYGDLHPAMQRHLDSLSQHVDNATTSYGAQPFETNPAPSVEHVPNMNMGAPAAGTATPVANTAQAAGQLPNQTAMQGASAGGSADTNAAHTANQTPKPSEAVGGVPNTPPPNIDTSDIDAIGQEANHDTATMAQQHQAQLAQQQAQQAQQISNSGGNPSNLALAGNQVNVPGFNGDQINNARQIIQNGLQRGMSRQDIETAVMAGLTESSLHNLNGGDRDSLGLFQMRPSQGWGSAQQVMDPNYEISKFYDTLAGTDHTGMTPWQAAQAVEKSAFSDGSNYQAQYANAQKLVDYLTMEQPQGKVAAPTMAANGSLNWISQNTNKYLDYDHWYGAQCVDLYDFYTTGFVGGSAPMVGTADEIWNNHDPRAYTQIDRSQRPQMGDVAIWAKGGYTPGSHVGIILGDNGDGTVKTLSNNATAAGPNGASAIVNLSKTALLGYLRPNRLMGA